MNEAIRVLTDLCAIDRQLGEKPALIDGLVAALEKRRALLRKRVPGALLASYDALARAGRRPAVVQVRDAHCSGCYLRLPPQLDSSIRRHESLRPCPYCGRLLYAPARRSGDENGDEAGRGLEDRPRSKGGRAKRAGGVHDGQSADPRPGAAKRRRRNSGSALRPGGTHRARERSGAGSAEAAAARASSLER